MTMNEDNQMFPEDLIVFEDEETASKNPFLSNAVYDKVKLLVEIILPGASTLYFTLAQIWGFPNAEKVVGSVAAVTIFLGLVLRLSTRSYNNSDAKYDGQLNVLQVPGEDKKVFSLDVFGDPHDLVDKSDIIFKVN